MKFTVKNRFNNSVLFEIEADTFIQAIEKHKSNLSYADLSYADLSYADLSSANLSYANLSSANLSYADLSYADLSYANLSYAIGINKYLTTNLYFLYDQPGIIRAYKIVNKDNEGIYSRENNYPIIVYEIGKEYQVENPDKDENNQCGAGINVATLDWCIKEYKKGYKILVVEFTAKDIACIPIGSDGKFRLSCCKVVDEKNLKETGLDEKDN